MKYRLIALLALFCLLLGGCSYWVLEETPVQVGSAVIYPTAVPTARP